MTEWGNFFVAMAGAAAALAGLIFVGMSISLAKILAIPKISGRGLESLMLLMAILIVSAFCLIPGQSSRLLGTEFICLGVVIWVLVLWIDIGMLKAMKAPYKSNYKLNLVISQVAVLPYMISGLILVFQGYGGVYWLIPGLITSFTKALMDAWVLLVEIQR
jgi:hypothetical protein